jgi:prepilin-type N-terminal cleavage/methylation domain-containing protein
MTTARRGFTIIELLVTMAIIGILAGLGMPRYRDVKRRALAAQIIGEFSVVRVAAYNYYAEKGDFPPDYAEGSPPPGLVPFLPQGFLFTKPEYTLDYDIYMSSTPGEGSVLAVTMRCGDPSLMRTVMRAMQPGAVGLTVGNSYTYIITGL